MSTLSQLVESWKPVLDKDGYEPIVDLHKRKITAQLLENQAGGKTREQLTEAGPTNVTGNIDKFDPILIKLVRRMAPKLIAYDVCGVQAMSGPSQIIFALKTHYTNASGTEAFMDEANTAFSGKGTHTSSDIFDPAYSTGTGLTAAEAETDSFWNEMAVSIEKFNVSASSYQLKATYSQELADDMKAIHGLDADQELVDILSTQLISEMNRRVVRTIYVAAKTGAQFAGTPGIFNLATDADGRHLTEKLRGLLFAIELDANAIAKESKMGKGNILICSAGVASALGMLGALDNNPNLASNLTVDTTGATFVGTLKSGSMRVYVDPYTEGDFYVVGYKGSNQYDAGLFYCPYIPLQTLRAVDPSSFQPAIGFKTRAGIVANPFTSLSAGQNVYYRKVKVTNLL